MGSTQLKHGPCVQASRAALPLAPWLGEHPLSSQKLKLYPKEGNTGMLGVKSLDDELQWSPLSAIFWLHALPGHRHGQFMSALASP